MSPGEKGTPLVERVRNLPIGSSLEVTAWEGATFVCTRSLVWARKSENGVRSELG